MFGIGMQEIMLICVIALIVVGPKKMPELARALGKGYGEFRRAFEQMRRSVETDLHTEEIRRSLLDLPGQPPSPPSPASPASPAGDAGLPYDQVLDGSPPPPERPEQSAPVESDHGDGPGNG